MLTEQQNAEILKKIVQCWFAFNGTDLKKLSELMFNMETSDGLPAEITFDDLKRRFYYSDYEWFYIIHEYLALSTKHKQKSGIGEERLKKIQRRNNEILYKFMTKGQFDI